MLAAGASKRFGRPKALLPWAGRPLVRHVADVALAAGLAPVVVVLGADAAAVRSALAGSSVDVVVNPSYVRGPGTSVIAGLGACPPGADAIVFLLCDQPLVSPELVARVVGAFRAGRGRIVRPGHGSAVGHPVLFDRALVPELLALDADAGGRAVIARHPEALHVVAVDDPLELADVDTPAAYQALLRQARRG